MDLNDENFDMGSVIRPFVVKHKPTLSRAFPSGGALNVFMGKSDYKQAFLARVRQARDARGYTQAEIAKLLNDMPQSKYEKYENRSLLPHDLVPLFCLATGVDVHWLFTGQHRKQKVAPEQAEPAPTSARRRTGG